MNATTGARSNHVLTVPLTRTQLKIYTYCLLNPGTATYHASLAFDIRGALDPPSLEIAVGTITRRHEMLRARIVPDGATPLLLVSEDSVPLGQREFADASGLETDPASPLIYANRPFDLDHDPLARFVLVRHSAEHYTLCIVVHHLVTDLWSMNVLCNELSSLYDACVTGVEPSLPAQVGTFADYAREERSNRGAEARERAVAYWRSVLAKGVSEASLPFEPPPVVDSEGDVERTSLAADQVARLRALANRFRCTPFVVLLSAYFVFLHRLTGQERVSIGSFFANRADPRFVNVCGLLFNDLPITVECAPTATCDEVLVQVRDEFLDLLPHATTPFDRSLVAEASRGTPKVLYEQHNVTCQLYESTPNRLRLEGCDVQQRRFFYGSKYDLMLYGSLSDDRLDLWFNYRVDRFDQKLVRAWLDAFECLLVGLMEDPHSLIANVVLEPSGLDRARAARDEVRRHAGNAEGTVAYLERCVAAHNDQVAVTGECLGERVEVTYGRLHSWAGRIAEELAACGVRRADRVGVHCSRGVALVAAHLGVLYAGGVSVPLNLEYPRERLRYIARDSAAVAVIADTDAGAAFSGLAMLNPGCPPPVDSPTVREPHRPAADDPAFLIYTSGTSGRPKGVLLAHRGIVNQVFHRRDLLGATAGTTSCVSLSTGFVTLPLQIVLPLFVGGRLLVYPEEVTRDPRRLFLEAAADGVLTLEVTVSQLDYFVRSHADTGWDASLRMPTVMVAGEKLRAASVGSFHQLHPDVVLVNAYGQTECTGMTLARALGRNWQVPLDEGVASRGNVVLVCDPQGRPLPPGFVGELYVSGEGVALGYWTGHDLDQTGFIDHPAMGRTFRTGDLGRSRSSGRVEVLGRRDGQVKLRGVRIEPGEVEEALRAIAGIEACAVVARPYPQEDLSLVAYLQVSPKVDLDDAAIHAALRASLPEIMIPAVFCRLDRLPLSANGKIDRRSLPDPHLYVLAPRNTGDGSLTEVEQVVLRLWRSALEMPSLSPDHNFFAAGGTSLQAVILVGEMAGVFGIDLSLDTIFRCPSARELAAVIVQLRTAGE